MKTFRVTFDLTCEETLKQVQDEMEQFCLGEFADAQIVCITEIEPVFIKQLKETKNAESD